MERDIIGGSCWADPELFQSTRPRGARRHTGGDVVADVLVSIHAPAWGATSLGGHDHVGLVDVSIHAPAWGATSSTIALAPPRLMFQSTHPRGARRQIAASSATFPAFQSTRPRGARPGSATTPIHFFSFQSTRPRGARQGGQSDPVSIATVSIHAPAWGATAGLPARQRGDAVSIHAPAWGATTKPLPRSKRLASFNPRARVGRDATGTILRVLDAMFQSTRPRGARRRFESMGNDVTSFNPRARVGRDLRQRPSSSSHNSFNPRARVGRDGVVPVVFGPVLQVSIHAPAWGATAATARNRACTGRFNPRARVGRDSSWRPR